MNYFWQGAKDGMLVAILLLSIANFFSTQYVHVQTTRNFERTSDDRYADCCDRCYQPMYGKGAELTPKSILVRAPQQQEGFVVGLAQAAICTKCWGKLSPQERYDWCVAHTREIENRGYTSAAIFKQNRDWLKQCKLEAFKPEGGRP